MKFLKWMDNNPKWLKIVLALPMLQILWGVYRVIKAAKAKNILFTIIGILLIIPGAGFMWLLDLITLIIMDKILWIE